MKTSVKTPALVPQPHGGALQRGNPGNRGGTGRPPSAIREQMRGSFEERIAVLEEIADSPAVAPADRLRAVDILGKHAMKEEGAMTMEDARAFAQALYHANREALQAVPELSRERQEAVFQQVRDRLFAALRAIGMIP